jgi:signal transduction histidine kinase
MEVKKIFYNLFLFRDCKEYNIGLWQCPSFVFFIMGVVNIAAMLGTYFIANRYTDQPEIVALIVIVITVFIFIIAHAITQGFDRLAQANKMKTEFVSIASHQLRTPLSAIRWTLNLLNDERLVTSPQTQTEYISLVQESNERMIKLVNDLLDVSRIEMGKMILLKRQTNLFVLTQKIINNNAAFALSHNITLVLDAQETLPNANTDPEKISLVIQNLIDNAIKYTKGKGEIKITMEQDGQMVRTSIKDSGVGIPEAQKKFVFQKFFRSDNALKNQTIGTGLGLFIAKSIVEESDGKIWFESQEGKGTAFYFTLPVYK